MTTVRASVAAFLKSVPDDVRVGVVSFAGKAKLELAPTTDQGKVQSAVNGLESDGETALYDGLDLGVRTLGTKGERSILLLSDGGDTASSKATQASVTAAIKAQKVRTEAVAFKTSESDQSALKAFASAGRRQRRLRRQLRCACRAPSPPRPRPSRRSSRFSLPLPAGSQRRAERHGARARPTARRSPTSALVDFGAGVGPEPPRPPPSRATRRSSARPRRRWRRQPARQLPGPRASRRCSASRLGAVFLGVSSAWHRARERPLQVRSPDAGREHRALRLRRTPSGEPRAAGARPLREPRVPR